LLRFIHAEEPNESIQFGEMLVLRRQRQIVEERREVEG
jgi:hypothetical protein